MKNLLALMLAGLISFGLMSCGNTENSKSADIETSKKTAATEQNKSTSTEDTSIAVQKNETGYHEVVDHAGNIVQVPNEIDCIVIDQIPILSTYMAYFKGSTPYIAGFAGTFKDSISKTVLDEIAPELMEAKNTVYAQGDLNVEEIMNLNPDVIFYNANNKEHYEILKKTGIPVVGFATVGKAQTPADPLTRYKEWLKLLEDVFGEKGKMDDFISYGDKIAKEVRERIDKIPAENRPNAMILFRINNGTPQVSGKGVFGDYWLKNLGVENVAKETNGFAQVSFEQIYNWNPDILFLNGPGISPICTKDVLNNSLEGANFSSLQAVVNKKVYNTTLGMWNWFTPNPDAPLVYAWLASNTYPEQFADYPLKSTIKEYYLKFYGYELSDAEIEEMLLY